MVPSPNGITPQWQKDIDAALRSLPAAARMSVYRAHVDIRPDAKQIDQDLLGAAYNHKPAHQAATKPDKPEKEYKSADYITALNSMGYTFRLCDLDDRVEINNKPLTDVIESEIRSRARDIGLNRVNVMRDAFITEANEHRYNPIKDYLSSLQWDGTDWITTLAAHFADTHDLFPTVFRRWLIGAVSKVFDRTQNRMLILDGEQGIGKSNFVAWLASPLKDYYHDSSINPDEKDHLIRLMTTFIWEVSELGATMRRADVEALKSFLTKQQVNVRMPYGHNDIIKPALASFVGTVNNVGGILNDASGNRRFMTVTLLKIDWDYKKLNVNQVWAQAVALWRNGESGNSPAEETQLIRSVNAEYEVEDPLVDLIQDHFKVDVTRTDWTTKTNRIREVIRDKGWREPSTQQVAAACKKLGIKQINTRKNSTGRVWVGLSEKVATLATDE
jgi:predicted P-loop ATPase